MKKSEHETVIRITEADLADGFFVIGTSRKVMRNRIARRLARAGAAVECTTHERGGKVEWWQWRIPAELLSETFCIKGAHKGQPRSVLERRKLPGVCQTMGEAN